MQPCSTHVGCCESSVALSLCPCSTHVGCCESRVALSLCPCSTHIGCCESSVALPLCQQSILYMQLLTHLINLIDVACRPSWLVMMANERRVLNVACLLLTDGAAALHDNLALDLWRRVGRYVPRSKYRSGWSYIWNAHFYVSAINNK